MSEQNSLQIAGEFQIETCKILTTSGMEFMINNVVQGITIFENIFTEVYLWCNHNCRHY